MSDLLLDTHVVLWFLADDRRLGSAVRGRLERDVAYVSAASTWEVALKIGISKLTIDFAVGESLADRCREQDFGLVAVAHDDAWAVLELPSRRADPFDRLIAATARRRGWTVVTADPAFADLGVPVVDATA